MKLFQKKSIKPKKTTALCHIDDYTNNQLSGWIYCAAQPNSSIAFSIYQSNQKICSSIANIFRKDLLNQNIGSGKYGFSVNAEGLVFDKNLPFEIISDAGVEIIIDKNSVENLNKYFDNPTLSVEVVFCNRPMTLEVKEIQESKIFNLSFYNFFANTKFKSTFPAIHHYLEIGTKKGLNPHPLFDTKLYLENSPDVAKENHNPLIHFIRLGSHENRNPHHNFLIDIYKEKYPESRKAITPLTHFIEEFMVQKEKNYPVHLYIDATYYLKENPDVKKAALDPICHYLLSGWNEGRNPNKYFNTNFYLELNQDVKNIGFNAYLHFILFGYHEGRAYKRELDVDTLRKSLKEKSPTIEISETIDIVLPVFNGYEFLKDLIPQIKQNTSCDYRLIIVEDKSTDKRILPFLDKAIESFENAILIKNQVNQGFVESVNSGLAIATNHVVILNSDTSLPKGWLQRLIQPIFNNPEIASVTPMTNAGTIASFPITNSDNELFLNQSLSLIDNSFQSFSGETYFETPTGVGFCMAMNLKAIKSIGKLDEKSFGKGYGEENDWCQRAIKAGFKNIVIPNLFIWHKHGGSFTNDEKKSLINTNTKTLLTKHPNYLRDVHSFMIADPIAAFRLYAYIQICTKDAKKNPKVFIDHKVGGGANIYLQNKLAQEKKSQPIILISYNFKLHTFEFQVNYKSEKFTEYFAKIEGVESFMNLLSIQEVFYNNIVTFPQPLKILEFIRNIGKRTKLIIPIHDFLPICQSFTLLNDKGKYCKAEKDVTICEKCKLKNPQFEHPEIQQKDWRNAWNKILNQADEIICFSNSSKTILTSVYNDLNPNKISVKPHKLHTDLPEIKELLLSDELNIGVVGTINTHKGSQVIRDLITILDQRKSGFITVFGEVKDVSFNSSRIYITGKYNPEDLPQLIQNSKTNIFFFTSIWPETFSFVTHELIEMGLPVAAFDIGAPADALTNYEKGKIIPYNSTSEEIYNQLTEWKIKLDNTRIQPLKEKIISSGYFDKDYYLNQYPDVKVAGVDPLKHFIINGGKEKRNPSVKFNTKYYLESNPDVAQQPIHPLIHYIDFGKKEGRIAVQQSSFDLYKENIIVNPNIKIAVIIHAFYLDILPELLDYTKNIPINYAILLSGITDEAKTIAEQWNVNNQVKIIFKKVENRGRDIAPAFISFSKEIVKYDFVCKIHTKKSLYTGVEQKEWRRQLIHNLIGSELIVKNILHQFNIDNKLGIAYPISPLLPYWAYSWLSNRDIGFKLQHTLKVPMPMHEFIDYPMGSMFWFRPASLKQLLNNTLTISDFKEEPCGNDGTYAHAIERAFIYISKHNGFNHLELNFETNSYAKNNGTKNLQQYAKLELKNLKEKIDVHEIISFDIFDTLIARKVLYPDFVIELIEKEIDNKFNIASNFLLIRKESESKTKIDLKKEVNYIEIYEEIGKSSLNSEIVNYAKKREFELEIIATTPRPQIIEAFNYAKGLGKEIYLISDMYLTKSQIQILLEKNNISGYDYLLVSNEINLRKDKATLWDWLLKNEIKDPSKFLHIGDNEHSDIQLTIDRGMNNFHLLSGIQHFKNSNIGHNYMAQFADWNSHQFLGLSLSKLFKNPLLGKNEPFSSPSLQSPFDTGYAVFGPILLSFMNWLASKNEAKKSLYFMAREGYFLKKAYDVFKSEFEKYNNHSLPKSHYFLTSRRAILGVIEKNKEVLFDIIDSNHFEGTIGELLKHRIGFNLSKYDNNLAATKISIPNDSKKTLDLITPYLDQINEHATSEDKGMLKYLDSIGFHQSNSIGVVDVGYSGTIQKHLFKHTHQPIDGFYFVTRETTAKWESEKNTITGFFGNKVYKNSETPIFKFNLYLEFWMTSPDGQLSHFEVEKEKAIPVYKEKESIKKLFIINEQIGKGVLQYITDSFEISNGNLNVLNLNNQNAQGLFEQVVRLDLWDEDTRKIAFLEDEFCGNKDSLDVIGDYKKFVL